MLRRELLRTLVAGAGLHWLERLDLDEIIGIGERLHADARRAGARAGMLGSHQRATMTLAAERIIPASDTPGATDANVGDFIEHMLGAWYDPAERDRLLAGLGELDARSTALHGRDFVSLAEADQIALLMAMDAEAAAHRRLPASERGGGEHWFATFKFLVVWGYCTSEVAMRRTLGEWPPPPRYDGCAPYAPSRSASG